MKTIKAFLLLGIFGTVLSCSEDSEPIPEAPTVSITVNSSSGSLTDGAEVEIQNNLTVTANINAPAGFNSATLSYGGNTDTKERADLSVEAGATSAIAEWSITTSSVGTLSLSVEVEDDQNQTGSASFSITVIERSYDLPTSIQMVDIPAGTFTMGGPTMANDAPEHEVTLSAFKMSEKEITNAEYLQFLNEALEAGWVTVELQSTVDPCGSYTENMVVGMGDAPNAGEIFLQLGETGGCTSDGHGEHIDNKSWIAFNETSNEFELLDEEKADWPINWLKWYGAYAFTEFYGVSLPTEAQWEYAARSGQSDVEYPTSTGLLDLTLANYNGDVPGVHNATGHSFPVGSYDPNPFGMYDMGGNVWEWCLDYYSETFYEDGATDPVNTTPGPDAKRIRRGGAWNYHASTLLVYARESDFQDRGNNHFGFRIAQNNQ